ncbi:MAG TPA: nucleotidyltransferase domain-containing protein [Chloroflexota bacterium]
MPTAIPLPLDGIREACRRFDVAELAVFGSVLSNDFRPESDVDFLVTFLPGADLGPWMSRFLDLQEELSALTGRPVDLVERAAIEKSRNPFRKRQILGTAEVVYAA